MRSKKKKKGRPKLCQVDGEDFASCEEEEVAIPRPCEGCTVGEEGKGGTSTEGKKQTCQPPAEVQDRAESADFGLEGHGGEIKGKERKIDRATAALRTQERAKELKHKTACEATRRDFVPFIVSTDGCVGEQAEAFLKRLGRRLAEKWQRSYSQVMGFIRSRMAVAILRASSQCLRGPRTRIQGTVCTMEDGAALGVVQL